MRNLGRYIVVCSGMVWVLENERGGGFDGRLAERTAYKRVWRRRGRDAVLVKMTILWN